MSGFELETDMDRKETKMQETKEQQAEKQKIEAVENTETSQMPKKPWFGRGIYGSKDVPIKILDRFIIGAILLAIVLTVVFAVNGGFIVSFDSDGGSAVASQKLRYDAYVEEPEIPVKAGYDFAGWYCADDPKIMWNFEKRQVYGDMTLIAKWTPAQVRVKFDPDGGEFSTEVTEERYVTFGEAYGELPIPEKDGKQFVGWMYSGQMIQAETVVAVNGEHILTAIWE